MKKVLTTVWLHSLTITDKDARITIDIYGTNNNRIFIIQSKSCHNVTTIIDAWSY